MTAPARLGSPAAYEPAAARRVGLVRLYAALLRTALQAASAYRAELVLSGIGGVVPLAFLALWRGAASDSAVDGVTGTQFATYYCLLLVTSAVQVTMWVIFDGGDLIYTGRLSAALLQPVHPFHSVVANAVAPKAFSMPLVLVAAPIALSLTGGRVEADPGEWLIAVTVAVLGWVSMAYLAVLAASVAFWMTKAQGVQGLLFGAEWLIGGIIAPVALLPGALPSVLRHQPVWFADGALPEMVSGISPASWWLPLEGLAWVLGLHLLLRVVWRRGVRRYEAVGT